ncbi:MAG: NADH-quinone oxidoreductase subunit N [Myxococcota bacterium]
MIEALAPFVVLLVLGLLLMMYEVFSGPSSRRRWGANLCAVGLVAAGLLIANQLGTPTDHLFVRGEEAPIWADDFARASSLILLAAALMAALFSPVHAERAGHGSGEYYALIVFSVLGMMVMVMAGDLITFFLGLETMSVAVYCLTGLRARDRRSAEAALKYFLMGAFATGFILFGIAFVYGATGSVSYLELGRAFQGPTSGQPILLLGGLLVLIGFGFKVAAVPFHMWAPDAYEGAPTPIAGFMASGVKAAAFASLLRLVAIGLGGSDASVQLSIPFLSGLAVLSVVLGNILALVQPTVKRMLAYSSVSHAGYLLIGVVAEARGNVAAGSAVLYYLAGYTFMTLGAFGVLAFLERAEGGPESERYGAYAGIGYRHPAPALAMVLFMLALGGIPPTAGFFGKLYIFSAAIESGAVNLALVGILGSIISIVYYLRVVVAFYMREEPEPGPRPEGTGSTQMTAGLVLAAAGVLWLGLMPDTWLAVTRSAMQAIGS